MASNYDIVLANRRRPWEQASWSEGQKPQVNEDGLVTSAEMLKIARAQMELLRLFEGFRLPECVAGHARSEQQPFPAVFPAANAPQAWSATTPLLLLEALLGLEADAPAQCLRVDPWLPEWLPQISLTGLRVGQARVDLRFWRDLEGNSHHAVIDCEGRLKVERRASQWRDCVAG